MDPDGLTASAMLTGMPHGNIASDRCPDQFYLGRLTWAYQGIMVDAPSCSRASAGQLCMDLRMSVGGNIIKRGTNDNFGLSPLMLDVDSRVGLDYYPFDYYIATGYVEVRAALP